MLLGEVVAGRFELERLAQIGGMGSVYQARDRITQHRVAVKLLRAPGGSHDARFLREAALLAELRHPAIVRHIAHGRTPSGELYMAMQWLEGEDLARRLSNGPLAAGDAIDMIRRVADGLAMLHDRGGVHRDLKPSNLFLENGDPTQVKILDFGIARATAALALTATGTVMGTPGYTAPEQARGAKDVDARADVFSLGCVLFECLTGRAAFRGEHVMAVLAKVLLEDPPRLVDVAPDAPPELEALIARLLDKDPLRRPRDGAEVRAVLDHIVRATPGHRTLGPLTPRPTGLGSDEQRYMCLVMCARPGAGDPRDETPDTLPMDVEEPASFVDSPTLAPTSPGQAIDGLAAMCRSHGARLEPLVDGSWVAFADRSAARQPATDQAAMAARVALAMRATLPDARIAIASGRGVQAGRAPVGEVIDRALTLIRDSAPGPVRIDALTAGLLGGGFDLRDDGDGLRLLAESSAVAPPRRVLGRPTPCVGRDRELSTLIQLFDEVATDSCARAVLVRAPAGYGKSRLRRELLARLRARGIAFEWLHAKGDPVKTNAPFALAGQVVRGAAGITDGEAIEIGRTRLAERVASVVAAPERARVAAFLGELAHVPARASDATLAAARRDAVVMGDQLRRAWDDWLAAEADRRPVVLVLEDLHVGDLSTVKLCDSALRNLRERPLLVLALGRPEIDLMFPQLWAERGLITINLPELSRRSSLRLVHELLGNEVDDAVSARIVDQSGGNAFYLEELCRVVHEGGDQLPGTVLAMVQARLEGLDGEARRLLRAGAVFGDRFPRDGVLALWADPAQGAKVDGLLTTLVERELLDPAPAQIAGQTTYAFRHDLVREAAYAMLTDRDRELGHRLAAEWLSAAGLTESAVLAEHFARGGVPERAVDGYLRAARDALEGNDMAAVLARVERGLACGARGEALGELLGLRAEAHRWRADYTASIEAAQLAMAVLPPGTRGWCAAATQAIVAYSGLADHEHLADMLTRVDAAPPLDPVERVRALARGCVNFYLAGRYDRADQLLDRIQGEVERAGLGDEPLAMARVLEARAFSEGARAEQGRALALLERVLIEHERAGDLRSACLARNNLGYTFVQLGAFARAAELLETTLRDAERMGQPFISVLAQQNLGVALAALGHHDRAVQVLQASIAEFEKQDDIHMSAVSRAYMAAERLRIGDAAGAARDAQLAADTLAHTPPSHALALAVQSHAQLALGDAVHALASARQAYAILESLGGLDEGEMLVRLGLAAALEASGKLDEARAVASVGAARLATLAGKLPDELRTDYLERVAENAALRRLSERLVL
jgi:serine/threonine protein kinase/tetratricopeptide (TPR) repeat protein